MTINVIFSENVRFSRSYQFSLVIMNGSRLIAGCFRFIFGSRYAESTRSKFGVSAERMSRMTELTGIITIMDKHPWDSNAIIIFFIWVPC